MKSKVLEELLKRENKGWWELEDKRQPLVTAGALYLLRKNGFWKKEWNRIANELVKLVSSSDAETLRYLLLLLSELKMNLEPIRKRLSELYDKEKNLWKYMEGFEGDPLISSAILIAMWAAKWKDVPKEVIEGIKENSQTDPKLAELTGSSRPVLTSLYRTLALALYGEVEEAMRIWEGVKRGDLVDVPPLYLLKKGIREDRLYPALLAMNIVELLGEDPKRFLEEVEGFRPEEWDNARLLTVGFYLELFSSLRALRDKGST